MKKRSKWGIIFTVLITVLAIMYLVPTFVPKGKLPKWYPFHKRIAFGLDLQGGLELRYTVDYKQAIADNIRRTLDGMKEEIAKKIAESEGKDPESLSEKDIKEYEKRFSIDMEDFDSIRITFKNPKDLEVITPEFVRDKLRRDFVRLPPEGNSIVLKLSDKSVIQIRDEVVNQTLDVIRKRVEAFGLVEPDIRKSGDTDIDIQLPGLDKEQMAIIRERIGQAAHLAFRIVDRSPEMKLFFKKHRPDLEKFKKKYPMKGSMLFQTDRDIDRATGQYYVRAECDLKRGKNDPVALNALESFVSTLKLPPDRMVGYELVEIKNNNIIKRRYWRTHIVWAKAGVTGDHLTRAMVLFDRRNRPYVSIEFDSVGAKLFERVTEKNVGEYMAIMLDNQVFSAPVIKERIAGGRARITLGGAKPTREVLKEAQSLVTVLTHGAYKAPVHKVHDFEVGPSLGSDTIRAGIIALSVGTVLIFLFMLVYYEVGGLVADIGLFFNILFTLAILVGFNAALTMPGIAGIVLTVGMAVDANVLINERIREEMRLGKGPKAAVDAGYARAFWTIFDANVTTALAGVVLLNYSSGPIYGFAVTLLIGIVVTFFTQVYITRIITNWYIDRFKPTRLRVGI